MEVVKMRLSKQKRKFADFVKKHGKPGSCVSIDQLVESARTYPPNKLYFNVFGCSPTGYLNVEELAQFLFDKVELYGWVITEMSYEAGILRDLSSGNVLDCCNVYLTNAQR